MIANMTRVFGFHHRSQMKRQLMAKEIKIHPSGRAAPFLCAQHLPVEDPRGVQICNVDRKMKRGEHERFPQIIGHFSTTGSKLPSHCAMIGLFCRINQFAAGKFILLAMIVAPATRLCEFLRV